jgi:hypothetical protein
MRRIRRRPSHVRAAPLLILLVACDPPPAMQSDPEVLWFRSRDMVSPATARQIVKEAAAQENAWAGPLYVMSPAAFRGKHLLDSDKLESGCDLLIAGARVSARVTAPKPEVFSELTCLARRVRRQSASKRGGARRLRGPSATGQQTRA